MPAKFVHLHNHTEYSLLDGAQQINDLVRRAKDLDMAAVAMTDHGNLHGAVEFYLKSIERELKPIIGCEMYLAPGSRFDKTPGPPGSKPYFHLVLLAENVAGFRNLMKLSSIGFLEGYYYRPRVDRKVLEQHAEGLIALTACMSGEIPLALRRDEVERAREALASYREIFGGDNVYLEIQDHGIDGQRKINEYAVALARETGVGLVATNDCHYLRREDHGAHDVLICIGTGKKVNEPGRMQYSHEHYFKSEEEMRALFDWIPEALDNSVAIAERCSVRIDTSQHHVPDFPVPQGETIEAFFRRTAREGFNERRRTWEKRAAEGRLRHPLSDYEARFERELEMIVKMGFPGYFLIVWDFIRHAREVGIPVGPGRGSAAGSLVAYSLSITDIDPLEYDLLFERFLNPERVSLPDIDVDFCYRRRGEVIEYVTQKYGRDNVAQIVTFGTLAAKAAIKDAGRVLDVPFAEADKLAKLVPEEIGVKLADAIKAVPKLQEIKDQDPVLGRVLDAALKLEGLSRHSSVHAAGVVITPKPVTEYAPVLRTGKNTEEIVTQWAKDEVEKVGLLKMDFLGLKTLTLITDTLDAIRGEGKEPPDLDHLPLDDPQTFELFARGDTSGVFQFESSGMRDILRRLHPEKFEDLIALNALYRPGPIQGGMIDDFIQRRHGRVKVSYLHPLLEQVLRETYGVIVYQEQVMQIASIMGGYTLGGADLLRRAMGKKNAEEMAKHSAIFVKGAQGRNVGKDDAQHIFDLMEKFAGYGFNKSHSAAYALVAYHTGYLKAHYPVHFMAALLTSEMTNTDKLVEYLGECRAMGIEIKGPDVHRSRRLFSVEGNAVRFGLEAVKGIGEGAVDSILEARERVGRFSSLDHLLREVDRKAVNRRVVEALAKSGGLDELGDRARLFVAVEGALDRAARAADDRSSGQASLFGEASETPDFADAPLPDVPPWSDRERLAGEKESLGFYLSGHPLEAHRDRLADVTTHTIGELKASNAGEMPVVLGGLVTQLKRRRSKKTEEWMAVFTLEDQSGGAEVVVFPKAYRDCGEVLEDDRAVVVRGRSESGEGSARVLADSVVPLDQAETRGVEGITIRFDGDPEGEQLEKVQRLLADQPGSVPVYFEVIRRGDFRLVLQAAEDRGVRGDRALVQSIASILGPGRAKLGRP